VTSTDRTFDTYAEVVAAPLLAGAVAVEGHAHDGLGSTIPV
jgi:hypothetical protein